MDDTQQRLKTNTDFLGEVMQTLYAAVRRKTETRSHGRQVVEISWEAGVIVLASLDDRERMKPKQE